MSQIQDVVIVGGGLVGGLAALLLAKEGVQATVLDAAPRLEAEQLLTKRDARVLALSPAAIRLLTIAGVWQHIARQQPYTGMQVWQQDGYGALTFGQVDQSGVPSVELGSMVEPSVINLAIQQELVRTISDYRTTIRVKSLTRYPDHWQICLANGEMLNTQLVIGADGANSMVREAAAIDLSVWDYHQTALSCAIRTQHVHQQIARQIFLPTGPLAFLPMASLTPTEAGYWQSIVWTLPADYADEYTQCHDVDFMHLLTKSSQYMLGEVLQVESRASFPLKARQAATYIQSGLALIGDAAHVVHPMAGQGVNLGVLDAAILVDALLRDRQRGSWAHDQTLRYYEHQRRLHNSMMMHSFTGLGWLQRQPLKPMGLLRNFGMSMMNRTPSAMNFFTQQASGLQVLSGTRYAG